MPELFTANFHWFFQRLSPHPGPEGRVVVPENLNPRDAIVQANESVRDMFVRCVNSTTGDPRDYLIADDLAVLGHVSWRRKHELYNACIQVIKTEGVDIETFYRRAAQDRIRYFRLDVDSAHTGMIFTHPHPHIHVQPNGGSRFTLGGWQSTNVVVDFFEHVFLECYHDQWLAWAEGIWNRHWAATRSHGTFNPFRTIVEAFRDSQFHLLENFANEIDELKTELRNVKNEAYRLRVDDSRASLLLYPTR